MHKREELTAIPMVTIRQMGKLIGKRFRPDKVILFGSYARGEGGVNSDVDLLVVMESAAPWFKRSGPIRSVLSEHWNEPVDVIVRSPKIYHRYKGIAYSLEHEATKDGVVLYEAKGIGGCKGLVRKGPAGLAHGENRPRHA